MSFGAVHEVSWSNVQGTPVSGLQNFPVLIPPGYRVSDPIEHKLVGHSLESYFLWTLKAEMIESLAKRN